MSGGPLERPAPVELTPWDRLGNRVPRRGSPMVRAIARGILRLAGWRVTGSLPNLPKFIFIAAPHTSNWDFPLGVLTMYAAGFRVSWFGKASLFRPPLGPLMRWLGGLPIDRSAAHGVVEQTVEAIRRAPSLLLAIAPEGTRQRVTQWRTGFYHVAHGADIPIVLAYFDYGTREVGFGPTMRPSGDLAQDLAAIQAFYRGVTARHPALFATGADPD